MTSSSNETSTDQFLQLIANPFESQVQSTSFYAALTYSFGVSGLLTLLFCLLRPRTSTVYAPRAKYADAKHAPPPVGKGLFSWINPIVSVKEAELVEKIGVDATVFLRFLRMTRNIFLCLSVVGCGVLIPTTLVGVQPTYQDWGSVTLFLKFTPQYISGRKFWAFVIVAYVFNIIICFFLWINYRAVTQLRRGYFESSDYRNSLHSRTLLLTHIPKSSRTDDGIVSLVEGVKATEDVPRTAIARNMKELPDLIEEYEEVVQKLEGYLATYLSNPNKLPSTRPTCKPDKRDRAHKGSHSVDAIDYLTSRIQELEAEIKEVRETIDKRNPLPYGFASYTYIEDAHAVAYSARKKGPHGTDIMLTSKPADLLWKNLPMSKSLRRARFLWSSFWIAVLTVLYIAPNMMTAVFLSNLNHLGLVWHAFQISLEQHRTWWAIVQGIASPAIQSLFYLILPTIFRRLTARSGDLTKTSRERHVFNKLYFFFVFNNLIVFSIFAAAWSFVATVIAAKNENAWDAIKSGGLVNKIAISLCNISPYWITWQMQRNLSAAVDLIQAWPLIVSNFQRHFLNPTPRQMIELSAPTPFEYADYYNNYMFVATAGLAYATLQPLVLPVTAFYFALDTWLKKYLLQYVFITKSESGGAFWRNVFNRFIFATLLADVVIALIVTAQGLSWTMLYCMTPLPFLLLGFKIYCSQTFDKKFHYYSTRSFVESEMGSTAMGKGETKRAKRSADRVAVRFGHPALYKKLMTPMVHAKSQHLLKQVYRGRLESDAEAGQDSRSQNGAYSEFYMTQMSHQQPGKAVEILPATTEGGSAVPFEFVAEHDLDFENFKRRSEFRDAFGGDGELYGRPDDELSRPSTPSTITTMSTAVPAFATEFGGHARARSQSPGEASTRASSKARETVYPRGYHATGLRGNDEYDSAGSPHRGRGRGGLELDIGTERMSSGPPSPSDRSDDDNGRGRLLRNAAGMGRVRMAPLTIAPTPGERMAAGGGGAGAGYFGLLDSSGGPGSAVTSGRGTPTRYGEEEEEEEEEETSYDYFRRGGGRRG